MLLYSIVSKWLNDNFQGCHGFSCNALKAGKQLDLGIDFHFTPSACHHHFTCGIERKEHFWKVLMNILNIIYFPRLSFSKCNFPSVGNLKIYSIQFQPFLFSQKPELNTDIFSKPFSICQFLDYKSTRDL